MNRIKVSEHFYLDEFVSRNTYKRFGKKSIWLLDPRLIAQAEKFRIFLNTPIIINNWAVGGSYQNSGYRTPTVKVGSKYSQHRFGRAGDLKFPALVKQGMTYEDIRDEIRENFCELQKVTYKKGGKTFFAFGMSTIEKDTPTWLHFDKRNTEQNELFEVAYK